MYIYIHDIFLHPNSDDAKIQNFWKSYNVDGSEILEILHQLKTVVNMPFFIGVLPSFWFMGCPRAHPPYRYPKSQVPPDGAYREVQAIGQDSPLKTWWFYGIFMGGIMGYTICWLWLTLCHGKSMKITMLLTGKPPISIRAMENTMANC